VIWGGAGWGNAPAPACQSLTATYQLGCLTWGGDIFRFDDESTIDFFEGRVAHPVIQWLPLPPNIYWKLEQLQLDAVDPLTCSRVIDDEGASFVAAGNGDVVFITQPNLTPTFFNETLPGALPPVACGRSGEHVTSIKVNTMAATATFQLASLQPINPQSSIYQWQNTRSFVVSSKVVSRVALLCEDLIVFSDVEGSAVQYLSGARVLLKNISVMITDVTCAQLT
jgi:hypothetical protein